jgi:hypothetical protein
MNSRAWNNIQTADDIYAGQNLLVRPANLAPSTPTVSPDTMPKDSPTAQALLNAAERKMTPSSPTKTVTAPYLAAVHPTSAETRVGIPSSANHPVTDSEQLIPFIAGISILVGCVLVFILIITKKPA